MASSGSTVGSLYGAAVASASMSSATMAGVAGLPIWVVRAGGASFGEMVDIVKILVELVSVDGLLAVRGWGRVDVKKFSVDVIL